MAYLSDMRATCKARATNAAYPLELLESIQSEFDKGLNGGIFDASYVLSKLSTLTEHVRFLEVEARKENAAEFSSGDEEFDDEG
jgi:hypothetical protein